MGLSKAEADALLARIRAKRESSLLGVVVAQSKVRHREKPPERRYKRPSEEDGRITFFIDPFPAPRQTRRDAWKPSPAVVRYREWKDKMKAMCAEAGWKLGDELNVEFHFAMPPSWTDKKRRSLLGKPHQQKPDTDNCCKALMDLQGADDGHVHTLHAVKLWAEEGTIVIRR